MLSEVSKLTKRKEALELESRRLIASVNENSQMNRTLQSAIISCEFQKQKLIFRINVMNDLMKRFQSIVRTTSETITIVDPSWVQKHASKVEIKMNNLMDAITKLKLEYLQFEEVISRIETLLRELKEIRLIINPDSDSC